MATDQVTTGDPVRDAIGAAAESVRAANHDGSRPETPGDLYSRVGNLADLLRKLDQLVGRLDTEADRLDARELRHDAGGDPEQTADDAAIALSQARAAVAVALRHADDAHNALSHLGVQLDT